jgi:hypothetical protein
MAVVVAVVAVALFGMARLSDSFAAPTRLVTDDYMAVIEQDARLVDSMWLGPDGRETPGRRSGTCSRVSVESFEECLLGEGFRHVLYVHEADRFWRFQLIDAGILVGASVLLGAVAVRRTLRR